VASPLAALRIVSKKSFSTFYSFSFILPW